MRSFQVFAGMSPEQATEVMAGLKQHAPGTFAQALAAAAAAFHSRPATLARQPLDKQALSVRRAMARVAASPVAEEILAVYFLECQKELVIEWLDGLGIAHEDGTLTEDTPAPPPRAQLESAVEKFRAGGDDANRELLLAAFAAQSSIEWPDLEALLAARA